MDWISGLSGLRIEQGYPAAGQSAHRCKGESAYPGNLNGRALKSALYAPKKIFMPFFLMPVVDASAASPSAGSPQWVRTYIGWAT